MMSKCIPFYKVRQDSRIVLYGYGKNGRRCYKRLIETGYCNLVGVIDKNCADMSEESVEVYPVSQICNMEFDFCLITVLDSSIVEGIRDELHSYGVDKEKILDVSNTTRPINLSQLSDSMYIANYLYYEFDKMKRYARYAGEYYPELEKTFVFWNDQQLFVLEKMKNILDGMANCKEKIILLFLMYECDCFDSGCMQRLFRSIINIEWDDSTYYGIVIESTFIAFLKPSYIYKEFFLDRKFLQRKICDYYKLQDIQAVKKSRDGKVAIVTHNYIPNNVLHAPSKICRDYANELASRGFEVRICVICSEVESKEDNIYLSRASAEICQCVCVDEETSDNERIEFDVFFQDNIEERVQGLVSSIMEFQPMFILDMGDECFPEAYALIEHFPIISMPMRGNSFSSCSSVSIFQNKDIVTRDVRIYAGVSEMNIEFLKLGNMGRKRTDLPVYSREDFGLQKEDFIVVTVGARLASEVDDDLIEHMVELMEHKSRIKWIFVGEKVNCDNTRFQLLEKRHRIINWGIEPNIESFYRMCNVYLNPKRRGGGMSIRLAMSNGLPVAMLNANSDATSRMRPDHLIDGGYDELVKYVKRLYIDNDFYRIVKEETLEQIRLFSFESDVDKVLDLCFKEVAKYNE